MEDRPGIIATLAGILADRHISIEAVLQLPCEDKRQGLPFVITVETTSERALQEAIREMAPLPFLREPPLALPLEGGV